MGGSVSKIPHESGFVLRGAGGKDQPVLVANQRGNDVVVETMDCLGDAVYCTFTIRDVRLVDVEAALIRLCDAPGGGPFRPGNRRPREEDE